MLEDSTIVVGDNVDLVGEKGRIYRSKVEDVVEGVLFFIGTPKSSSRQMPLSVNDEVDVFFYRESGRYIAQMRVAGFEKKGELRSVMLLLSSKPQKNQRRKAYRLPARLDVQICQYVEGMENSLPEKGNVYETPVLESVNSKDISLTGVGLLTERDYEQGEKYLLKLFLNKTRAKEEVLPVCAFAARSVPWHGSGMKIVGMQFFGLTRTMSENISRYVISEQQKLITKKTLTG